MYLMSFAIELVVPYGLYRCGYLHTFKSFQTEILPLSRPWGSMQCIFYAPCPLISYVLFLGFGRSSIGPLVF